VHSLFLFSIISGKFKFYSLTYFGSGSVRTFWMVLYLDEGLSCGILVDSIIITVLYSNWSESYNIYLLTAVSLSYVISEYDDSSIDEDAFSSKVLSTL
jgi:hypothetical protein